MKPRAALSGEQLRALGYRRISHRHGLIARIDCPTWAEKLGQKLHRDVRPGDPRICWEDHYRRCYSADRLQVPASVAKICGPSNWDFHPYVPAPGDSP